MDFALIKTVCQGESVMRVRREKNCFGGFQGACQDCLMGGSLLLEWFLLLFPDLCVCLRGCLCVCVRVNVCACMCVCRC